MEGIHNKNEEVLIFNYIREWGPNQNIEDYIRGTIISSELSDDLSLHGSPYNVVIYTVLGEDGNLYRGNYDLPLLGNSFFLTEMDYIRKLHTRISFCDKKIEEENKKKEKYQQLIDEILKKEKNIPKKKTLNRKNEILQKNDK